MNRSEIEKISKALADETRLRMFEAIDDIVRVVGQDAVKVVAVLCCDPFLSKLTRFPSREHGLQPPSSQSAQSVRSSRCSVVLHARLVVHANAQQWYPPTVWRRQEQFSEISSRPPRQ